MGAFPDAQHMCLFRVLNARPPVFLQEFSLPTRHLPAQWLVEKVLLRVRTVCFQSKHTLPA